MPLFPETPKEKKAVDEAVSRAVSRKSRTAGSLADMTLEEAEALAKQTDYAFDLCDCGGLNPVNWADAGAFFLEGYLHARKQANK